ncbi:hypothetical protein CW354_14135 [Marinicaulis flavus]|uniref:Uncharacterized protein n=1 Tax=Hyphococcus luteus TaxID=2058213 RepID=A0A2S7K3T3_9PROT|nr:hypothetical protein CW354_14135 [Marinicaulis flavus]
MGATISGNYFARRLPPRAFLLVSDFMSIFSGSAEGDLVIVFTRQMNVRFNRCFKLITLVRSGLLFRERFADDP